MTKTQLIENTGGKFIKIRPAEKKHKRDKAEERHLIPMMKGYDRLLELNVGMGEEFIPMSDRKVNKLPIVICALIVGGVMITSMGTRFVLPFFSGTFFNDNGETVATTYSLHEGESGMGISKGDINSININLNACKIIIEPAEGDGLVDVEYTGDKRLKPDVTFENGKLRWRDSKNSEDGLFSQPR